MQQLNATGIWSSIFVRFVYVKKWWHLRTILCTQLGNLRGSTISLSDSLSDSPAASLWKLNMPNRLPITSRVMATQTNTRSKTPLCKNESASSLSVGCAEHTRSDQTGKWWLPASSSLLRQITGNGFKSMKLKQTDRSEIEPKAKHMIYRVHMCRLLLTFSSPAVLNRTLIVKASPKHTEDHNRPVWVCKQRRLNCFRLFAHWLGDG